MTTERTLPFALSDRGWEIKSSFADRSDSIRPIERLPISPSDVTHANLFSKEGIECWTARRSRARENSKEEVDGESDLSKSWEEGVFRSHVFGGSNSKPSEIEPRLKFYKFYPEFSI